MIGDTLRKIIGIFVVLLICGSGSSVKAAPAWQLIDGQRVMNYIKDGSGLWLIDVRSSVAYEACHIEGSVDIPSNALIHKKFPGQKMIVLVDDSLGQKSARESAEALVKKGHQRVSVLEGGLAAWKVEGRPIVESKEPDRGVTADELKWALANSVPMKIYDLRDVKLHKQETVKSSEHVAGKTTLERVEKLKTTLAASQKKKKDLAERIKKHIPIVLIFSATDDAAGYTKTISLGLKVDIRYLIGGYEALISDRLRGQQKTGACPTCPSENGK